MDKSVGKVASFYRYMYPPSPISMLDFPGKKTDFSYLKNSNIEYEGGGPQEHGIFQILQQIVGSVG